MERTFYVIETKIDIRYGTPKFEVRAAPLPESREDAMQSVRDELDAGDYLTAIRITRVDWDVPPQDVTEEFMAEIAREWAEKDWPYRRILSDYGYDEFAEQLAREADEDRAHIRAELAKRT